MCSTGGPEASIKNAALPVLVSLPPCDLNLKATAVKLDTELDTDYIVSSLQYCVLVHR